MTRKKTRCVVDKGESRREVDEVKSRCMVGKGTRMVRPGERAGAWSTWMRERTTEKCPTVKGQNEKNSGTYKGGRRDRIEGRGDVGDTLINEGVMLTLSSDSTWRKPWIS